MQMVKPFGDTCKTLCAFLILSFVVTLSAHSQNIFLDDNSGFLTFGQLSQVEHLSGQAVGLNYSFDGKSAVGVRYGSSTLNGSSYQDLSLYGNFLLKKQKSGDPFNLEVVPAFERKYHDVSAQNKSLFSMAAGISRNLSNMSNIDLIPRANLSYLVSPSVGVTNFLSAGMDLSMAVDINSNVKLVVNPGVNFRMDNGRYNGVFTSGLLIQ